MKRNQKMVLSIGMVVIGLVAIVFAVICLSADPCKWDGTRCAFEQYGGDAYTGMQNASANTANNVLYLDLNLQYFARFFASCMGYLLSISGALIALIGSVKLWGTIKE